MSSDREAAEDERDRKLFVGGLGYDTTDDKLKDHFEQYGELTDYVVVKFTDTKKSRRFGFVTFRNPKMVEECLSNHSHTIDGKTVELKRATPREDDKMGGDGRYDEEDSSLAKSMPVTGAKPLPCSYCGGVGCVRCSVCKVWYCSPMCQANHWAHHRRD